MRSVHVLGLGLVVGAAALGAMLAIMAFRWQAQAYPEKPHVAEAAPSSPGAASQHAADTSRGKAIFDAKCGSCHTVGGGKRMGPDLKGIASKRQHDWLVQFIVEPDRVIAGGDPIAAQLVKEYGMPMPNVGVSRADAEEILKYLGR